MFNIEYIYYILLKGKSKNIDIYPVQKYIGGSAAYSRSSSSYNQVINMHVSNETVT